MELLCRNEDILSGLHSNTHLVLVNGFAQRYAVTKETKYRDAVLNFWNILTNFHVYANGKSHYIKCTTDKQLAYKLRDLAEDKVKAGIFKEWFEYFKKNGRNIPITD